MQGAAGEDGRVKTKAKNRRPVQNDKDWLQKLEVMGHSPLLALLSWKLQYLLPGPLETLSCETL